jgi:hypothetical protein
VNTWLFNNTARVAAENAADTDVEETFHLTELHMRPPDPEDNDGSI